MRKLGVVVVVLSMVGVSVATADEMKKKAAPPAADKAGGEAAGAKAAPPPPPPAMPTEPPKPGPELEAIKGMTMNWKCEGTMMDPTGANVAYTSSWKGKADLNKLWIAIEYKQTVKKPKMVFTGKGYMGWSAAEKKYIFNGFDDWGGNLVLTSPGWGSDGKTMVFTGTATGPINTVPFKITFAKGDTDKQGSVTMEAQIGKDWINVQSETCKR